MRLVELKWKRQWGGADRIVWVNVAKIDAAWLRDKVPGYYVPRGRSEYIGALLRRKLGQKIDMPHVGYWEGRRVLHGRAAIASRGAGITA